jgi:Tol biopolymer transport system component/DNA-binding winged helix-turn-helix (wHTH) protein
MGSSPEDGTPFMLQEWLVQPELNRISRNGVTHQVEPRIMQVLVHLARRAGRVVSRNELLETIWPETVVCEDALTRAVYDLRQLLEDDSRSPRYIETIRKGGYRLLVPPRPCTEAPREARQVNGDAREQVMAVSEQPRPAARRWTLVSGLILVLLLAVLWWSGWLYLGRSPQPPDSRQTSVTPFTSYPGEERYPAISPDGTQVAFCRRSPASEDSGLDIYLKQQNTETPLRLTSSPGSERYPTWSPDGCTIAYFAAGGAAPGIYTVPAIGGETRKLVALSGKVEGISWSPDGRQLVFSTGSADAPARLYRHDLVTGETHQLVSPPSPLASDVLPAISPDGKTLAFVRVDASGQQQLWLVPMAGGEARRPDHAQTFFRGLDWSMDGQSLVVGSFLSGAYGLWQIDISSGAASTIPSGGEWCFFPSVARQRNRLVYEKQTFEKNIWQIRIGETEELGQSTSALVVSSRMDCEASFSPDAGRIAFVSSRSGSGQLWVCNGDGSHPMQLTFFQDAYVANPRWSPDGRQIAFYSNPQGFGAIFIIDAAGGTPRAVSPGSHNQLLAGWSADGRWIYFGSDRGNEWRAWKVRIDGTGVRPATTASAIIAQESCDGRRLFYTKPERPGLWSAELVGGEPGAEQQILEDLPRPGRWHSWVVFAHGIALLQVAEQGPAIVYYDLASGSLKTIALVPNFAASLSVSQDGRAILYARVERIEGDVMLLEGFFD